MSSLMMGVATSVYSPVTIDVPISGNLYSFSTFTFTNAGTTGNNGPLLANCLSSYDTTTYSWLNNSAYFNMSVRGVQQWTVPANGTYEITAAGAAGGDNLQVVPNRKGGEGAVIKTRVDLNRGDILNIVVGQRGADRNTGPTGNYCGGSGGGGTFVYLNSNTLYYVVAGGGGGAAAATAGLLTSQANTANGRITSNGANVIIQGNFFANGGIGGLGGNTSSRATLFAGAGAGILSDGQESKGVGSNGRSRANGWIGGYITRNSNYTLPGGFGGGGASGDASNNVSYIGYSWSGGGGGYSGGGGGGNGGAGDGQFGGGGGSYWIGTLQSSQSGGSNANGYVIITKI